MSPLLIGVILIISWASHEGLTKGDYIYPAWADGKLIKNWTASINSYKEIYSSPPTYAIIVSIKNLA